MAEEKELIEYLAKKLVDNPDGVSVKVIEGEKNKTDSTQRKTAYAKRNNSRYQIGRAHV